MMNFDLLKFDQMALVFENIFKSILIYNFSVFDLKYFGQIFLAEIKNKAVKCYMKIWLI